MVIGVGVLALWGSPAQASADDEIGRKLTNDKISVTTFPHPKSKVRWGRAESVFDAPPEQVLKVVHDYAHYAGFLPHFEASRVLSRRGNDALVYLEAKIIKRMVTVWAQMKLKSKNGEGNTKIIEGKMLKGNVDVMQARWEVTPVEGGKTKVAFQLIMDPGIPLVHNQVNYFGAKATKQTLQALRKKLGK
jgi:ribosome-associated toxin RatA of RatAB toxin-antitoxin module